MYRSSRGGTEGWLALGSLHSRLVKLTWWQVGLMVGAGVSLMVGLSWAYGYAPRMRRRKGGGGGHGGGRGRRGGHGGGSARAATGGPRQMSDNERMLRAIQECKALHTLLDDLLLAHNIHNTTEEEEEEEASGSSSIEGELEKAAESVLKNVRGGGGAGAERLVVFLREPKEWQVVFPIDALDSKERYTIYSTCERLGLHHKKTQHPTPAICVRKLEPSLEDIFYNNHNNNNNNTFCGRGGVTVVGGVSLRDCLLVEEEAMKRVLELDAMATMGSDNEYRRRKRKMIVAAYQRLLAKVDLLKEYLNQQQE